MADRARFRRLFRLATRRRNPQEDVAREVGFHLEMRARDLERRGVDPVRARAEARRLFGDVAGVEADCSRIARAAERAERGGEIMDLVRHDVAFAWRSMRRHPTYTAVAALTLALGIGATTAIFSVVRGVLLRPLPYAESERIYRAWANRDDGELDRFSFRKLEYRLFTERGTSISAVGADFELDLTLVNESGAERIEAAYATPGYFEVFGTTPRLGRTFTAEDADGPQPTVAILTHGFWTRRLGADPDVIGQTITTNGVAFTVVGVLPEDFRPLEGAPELYVPYTVGTTRWIARWLNLYVKLEPGADPERAEEEMTTLVRQLGETDTRSAGWSVTVEPLRHLIVGNVEPALLALFATVGLVLLIACANVASLSLARATVRGREISVRHALGAGRGRIARQMLVESVVLGAVGGAAGLVVAEWGVRTLLALAPPDLPRLDGVGIDAGVLGFAAAVTLLASVGFGLAPIVHAVRGGGSALRTRDGSRAGHHRLLGALVVGEFALALVLLVGAGLVLKSLTRLLEVNVGFDRAGVLAVRLSPPPSSYAEAHDVVGYYRRLETHLAGLPGVQSVGVGSHTPLRGQGPVGSINSEARVRAGELDTFTSLQRVAGPELFNVLETPVRAGRVFTDADDAEASLRILVNETLARRLFPDGDAVGQRVLLGRNPEAEEWQEIIGVVGDVKYQEVERATEPTYYQAHPQWTWRAMVMFVRTAGDVDALRGVVTEAIRNFDADVPQYDIETLEAAYNAAVAAPRFNSWLFGTFAAVALILAAAGIYGVLSFVVNERGREIGIRMAMGARQPGVIRLVLQRGLLLVGTGAVLGTAGAVAATRLVESLLFSVSPTDAVTFIAVVVVLGATALVASYLPARRASRVDPAVVLREE